MQSHRPTRPTPTFAPLAAPLIAAAQLAALAIVAMLTNAGWTNSYRPTPDGHDRTRRGTRPGTAATSGEACGRKRFGRSSNAATGDAAPDKPVPGGSDATHPPVPDAAVTGVGGSERPDGAAPTGGHADEEKATAQRFLVVALHGGLGEAYQQAARTAVAVATEHGFAHDPKRVAEALVVFLHPDHR